MSIEATAESLPDQVPGARDRGRRSFGLTVFLVAAVLGGAIVWTREHNAVDPGAAVHPLVAPVGEEGVLVETVRPEPGGLTRTSVQIGSVHPFEQAHLFAKVSGYLRWQVVDIGSRVKNGEVVAQIDDPEVVKEADRAAAAVAQAKAVVVQALARLETTRADAKAAEATVAKARADIGSYTSRRKYREKELARHRDLYSRKAVPQQVVDEYEDHYETAVSGERTALAELASTQALFASAQAKIDQAEADLAEARSSADVHAEVLAKAKVLVEYATIRSPYDGIVTSRTFFVGDFIRSAAGGNERPMLTVARTDKMRVVTYVPDRDVPYTDVGDRAIVTLDALPGRTFEGQVSRYSYSEEAKSRTMRTEIDLDNPQGLLREGMYGVATIVLDRDTSRLTIPTGCLSGMVEHGASSVFVVKGDRARETPVTVGADTGIRVEILKGLDPSDEVIVNNGAVAHNSLVTMERPAQRAQ